MSDDEDDDANPLDTFIGILSAFILSLFLWGVLFGVWHYW